MTDGETSSAAGSCCWGGKGAAFGTGVLAGMFVTRGCGEKGSGPIAEVLGTLGHGTGDEVCGSEIPGSAEAMGWSEVSLETPTSLLMGKWLAGVGTGTGGGVNGMDIVGFAEARGVQDGSPEMGAAPVCSAQAGCARQG